MRDAPCHPPFGPRKSQGLVDLQVNGFAGVDFNMGSGLSADQIDVAMRALLATGVTCLLPTLITATERELLERFLALDTAISTSEFGAAMCPGYHLEGPFLNPGQGYSGCHPAAAMTTPDYGLVERLEHRLSRPILLITLAPELPGADAFIRLARAAGKLVAIGHTAADVDQTAHAATLGAQLVTHLGNGLPPLLPKLINPIMAQLAEDRLCASFIADGIHIPPHVLKVLIRAVGSGRALLVSDAVAAAAAPCGLYPFAGMTIERDAAGIVRRQGQAGLAGSSLCLDTAVRNLVAWKIASPDEAIAMASARPAQLLAPALATHGIVQAPGELVWSAELTLAQLRFHDVSHGGDFGRSCGGG